MAHSPLAAAPSAPKSSRYDAVLGDLLAVLDGEPDRVARMATVSCLLAHAFPEWLWTGFYVVDAVRPDELVVGPYQGTLGCLRIAFGRGVCGAAAATGQTQVVPDVHAFPGHIACDSRSRSEIVVPVRDAAGALIAVLDVDSAEIGAFDAADRAGLERLIAALFAG
jgi:GAF domain-containing protein